MENKLQVLKWTVRLVILGQVLSIYVPDELNQTPRPYTTGLKIKTSLYKTLSEPYYHSNYSKVYVHNKNYTSSLLDSTRAFNKTASSGQSTKLYPVYMSEEKKEKIKDVLKEHNANIVDKEVLNNRVVYKRRIEKTKNIQVFNKCPKGLTGQFVYDSSCNQYLDCWSGRGGPRNCAPGTLFNPKTLECDFPEKVECLTGPSASSLTLQRSARYQNYEQAKCPEGFSGLIPNYTNCTKYIQCNSGIQTPGTCPPGTLFDIKLNVCNHPRETTCFSGQSGTRYVLKEQSGGSTDRLGHYYGQYQGPSGQYQGATGQYQGQTGQYQGQTGQYVGQSWQYNSESSQYGKQKAPGVSQGQAGQFSGQTNYLGLGQSRDTTYGRQYHQVGGSQAQENVECDPTNVYCNSGGYIISGEHVYRYPQRPQGGSGTASNFGQGTRYYGGSVQTDGCNQQTQNCQTGTAASYDQVSFSQAGSVGGQSQTYGGTVYIQYIMCNPAVEECTNFQQGTYMLGPGGTLCNPIKQNCDVREHYIPSNKMHQQIRPNSVPSSGTYYVKYIICNPSQEDCSMYQRGIIEATYGVPGTLIGVQPVQGSSQSSGGRQIPRDCNPQIQNCDTIQYQGEGRPQLTTYDHISGGQGQPGQICNPQYQNCGQDTQGNTGRGSGSPSRGLGVLQTIFQGPYPKKFNSSTNYTKACNAGYENCYQAGSRTPTKTYGIQGGPSAEPKCPEGFQGITAHPTNCKKFLNCANGLTYVQDCAPGTLFNPFISTCDFPYNVDCKDGNEDATTVSYPDLDDPKGPYDKIEGCQGSQCTQGQGYVYQGQYGGNQNRGPQRHIDSSYGQTSCHGSYCRQGQFGQGPEQQPSQVQGQPHGQIGNTYDQRPGQGGCQGINCVNKPNNQDQYNPGQGQTGTYGSQHIQGGCQGSQCAYIPQGSTSIYQGQGCQGTQCQTNYGYQGYTTPSSQGQGTVVNYQGPVTCQGQPCSSGQTFQGYHPTDGQGQIEDYGDQISRYATTTPSIYSRPTQGYRWPGQANQGYIPSSQVDGNSESNVMKISTKKGYQEVTPINKFDRVTYGGFNNKKSVDYEDIYPHESRNYAFATTAQIPTQKPERHGWASPYPDLVATDQNADYIFEYEDGEPVTLTPEKINAVKRKKTRCDANDFLCDKKSCVAKNFVCDGVRDCDDGQDEQYCQKYLNEFKLYKNSRLDVLERQRLDNVSLSTCALLCTDNKKFECKSFNYRKLDRACFLTNENIGSSGGLKVYYPCDYYERKSTSLDCSDMHKCPNGKCLTSDQICDGYDDCGDRADEKGCRAEDFGYTVKLAGGQEENEGRVEVTVFGKTGYICDDQFSITDAHVLCKELGFYLGAAEVKGNSFYAKDLKESKTLYMMDDIECIGNETSIMHCNFAGWGIHNCRDKEIAGVICKTPEETCSDGFWKCDTGNECVRLPFLCDDLDDCTDNSDEASHHCNSPTELRLVNGSRGNEGRLEIKHHGIWGSVCDDDFNDDAAKIVCRDLGFFGSAYVKKDAYFGQSSGPIWLDQVSCYGNETSIEKCTHWEWGDHNCDHSEDVGVVCSNEVIDVDAQRSSKSVSDAVKDSIKNSARNSSPEPVSCGYRKGNIFLQGDDVHFRVVQGSTAKPGDYPWQAALRIKGQEKTGHWCGAVVIASKWVLTAAHCLEGYPKGAYVVVAGEYDMDEEEGTEQQVFIEEYYIHEHFREGHKMGNDIAMIKLKGNGFNLNQDIQPICLPDETADYERELNCTISGFGTIQTGKSTYSHKLRAAWIPVLKMDVCKMAHIYGDSIAEGMVCAGDLKGGVDACDGDSGGPLACLEDGVFTLYGLTSWGQRCGYANKPGVYVKVSHYKKWIRDIMKNHT